MSAPKAPLDEARIIDVAQAMRKRRFERTGAGKSFDPDVPPTENELDDAHAALSARVAELEGQVAELARCLLPVHMTLAERELIGEPLADDAVVLSFMGSGASDRVTAGEVRRALLGRTGP